MAFHVELVLVALAVGGGLALLWTQDVCVKLQTYDKLHIDVLVVDPISGAKLWRFTVWTF